MLIYVGPYNVAGDRLNLVSSNRLQLDLILLLVNKMHNLMITPKHVKRELKADLNGCAVLFNTSRSLYCSV